MVKEGLHTDTALESELETVTDQVDEYLLQSPLVTGDIDLIATVRLTHKVHSESQVFACGLGVEQFVHFFEQVVHGEVLQLQLEVS